MARHRHGRSPARNSAACHQNPCRHSAALPFASHDQCTPSRTDFIPSWLQHVQTSYYDSSREVPREASPVDALEASWHPNGIPNVRVPSSYDAGRYQSSDLFIQDTPSPAPPAIQTSRHRHYESDLHSDYDRVSDDRRGGYRSKPTISTPPPASVVKDDVFEKRPRRKTRQDRYNTVKSRDAVPTKKQAKKPSTRVSKMKRLRSSREVMANFKSSAITNPHERLTLKSTFTPGLFVNGRSSAPLADLVFNDIPLPDEDSEPIEREELSNLRSNKLKEEMTRREQIDYLTNALKRLKEDYPASEYPVGRAISITSGGDYQSIQRSSTFGVIDDEVAVKEASPVPYHRGLDGGGAPDETGDSGALRSLHNNHELQSHSICSRSAINGAPSSDNTLNKSLPLDGDCRLEDQKRYPEKQAGPEPTVSRDEVKSCSSQAVRPPNYQDKGIMVSPWMHQRAEIQLRSPNAAPQVPILGANHQASLPDYKIPGIDVSSIESPLYGYSAYLPGVSASLSLKAKVKDAPYCRGDSCPAWFFGKPSSQYPLLTLDPYANPTPMIINDHGPPTSSNTQSRNACNLGIPPQPASYRHAFPISQETHDNLDLFCADALQDDGDVPGESLTDYIERMEREILGPDEISSSCIDDALLPAQPLPIHGVDVRYREDPLRRTESKQSLSPKLLAQGPVREELSWPSQQYQSLSRPESLDYGTGSELASFWRPNHMMWC
ncbi:hypothetical protein J3F83DRAFT_710138 [Trichoderma novae-zelandiae]